MPKPKAPWFVRFVVHAKDEDSGRRSGVFQAMYDLLDSPQLSQDRRVRLDEIRMWFKQNLATPERLALSTKPHRKDQAIGWFKESAVEHMTQVRAMILILEAHGLAVERIRTRRPGYVVYEDEHQVAAYPFADTPT
jgi:hypothetical protein